ncbi:MAG: tetratricopeptide repeat protein [Candidatus Acidiferrales bacterium]
MQLEVSIVEKSFQRAAVIPLLVLNLFLSLTLVAWPLSAKAQQSAFDDAEGEISGTVLLESNKRPAGQVAVSLKSRAAGIFRSVLTDLEGRFKVQNLPRGTYEIAVDENGYEAAQTSAQLDGPSSKLVMYLRCKPGSIRQSKYTVSVRELKIPRKAQNEYQKGLERAAKNDLAGSLSHLAKATQSFSGYFEAYYNMGVVQMTLGHEDEAGKAFQTAIDLSGGRYAQAEFGYGYLLCQEGKADEAEKLIRRGLEEEDAAPDGYVILSEALVRLNRVDEAEKSAREALLRNPSFASAYLALSDVDARKNDYRAEIADLDIYLRLQPSGPGSEQARQHREVALRMLTASQPQN